MGITFTDLDFQSKSLKSLFTTLPLREQTSITPPYGVMSIEFPCFELQWFNKEEIQKLGRDLINYDTGKSIKRNQPVFWRNVMVVIENK